MDAHLRAGIAVYNAGGYHAAHDAWEDHWLELESGTDDERFLHGLIQFTAAVHHGQHANWGGLQGLAESALEYLTGLPDPYRGVDLGPVCGYLEALASDPEYIERTAPIALTYEGAAIELGDLEFAGVAVAADVLAEESERYEAAIIDDAVRYAESAIADNDTNEFVTFLFDFVTEPDQRGIVYQRLSEHVERRRSKEADVEGLFEE
ncbi:MAG: DUF309 domain-containing protein [Halobacteriales archaeon]|nr:DUF309 domain-containing protein [Halobacteriales archaeon]